MRAYTSPVGYFTQAEFHHRFADVVNRIDAEQSFLRGIGREEVRIRLFNTFLFAATCTKHPGFWEELELMPSWCSPRWIRVMREIDSFLDQHGSNAQQ